MMRAEGLEPPRAERPPAPKSRHRRAGPVLTGRFAQLERVQAVSAGTLLPNLLGNRALAREVLRQVVPRRPTTAMTSSPHVHLAATRDGSNWESVGAAAMA